MIITVNQGGQPVRMEELVALAKSLIQPGDLTVGGALRPEIAAKIISLVFADPFLTKVKTIRMSRLTRDIDVMDIPGRQLKRIAEGAEPADADTVGATEHGRQLFALPVQLFPTITLSFLRDNADNPNLIKEVEASLNTALSGDLVDLAFNGVADDNSNGFLTLNKGWVQIAKDDAGTVKVDIDPETDGWAGALDALLAACDERFRNNSVFVMSAKDFDLYATQVGFHVTGTPLIADSPLYRFKGVPIHTVQNMPSGHAFFTPLQNFAFGLHTQMERTKAFHARKRVLEYTFDMACDFEFAVAQAVVLGKPVA